MFFEGYEKSFRFIYSLQCDNEIMSRKKYKYHTINLPKILADKITDVIESEKHGYLTISDFVKDAVRIHLRSLGYIE